MEKPDLSMIKHDKLINAINDNYKPSATIWNCSTADAIRYTKTSGRLVWGSDHIEPGKQRITRLENLIEGIQGIPPLNDAEKQIAKRIINDLSAALSDR